MSTAFLPRRAAQTRLKPRGGGDTLPARADPFVRVSPPLAGGDSRVGLEALLGGDGPDPPSRYAPATAPPIFALRRAGSGWRRHPAPVSQNHHHRARPAFQCPPSFFIGLARVRFLRPGFFSAWQRHVSCD